MEEEKISFWGKEAILVTENDKVLCGIGFGKKCKGDNFDYMVPGAYRGSVFWVCTGCANFKENSDIEKVSVEDLEERSDNISDTTL